MAKTKDGFVCIGWWQTETVTHKDRVFTFSPFGLGQIDGWALMSWSRLEKCDKGHSHVVNQWHHFSSLLPPKTDHDPAPHVPRAVWRALLRKTLGVKKAPWPGRD